jgi:hypothetical protein
MLRGTGIKGDAMARALENPDRDFSADGEREGFEFLRQWITESDPALPYNEAAKFRIGKAIGDAVLPSCIRPPVRHLPTKRAGRSDS